MPTRLPSALAAGLVETTADRLNPEDPIFTSIRSEYAQHNPPFDTWWTKCCTQQRRCISAPAADGTLAAVAVLTIEELDTWTLPGPVLKICLFKVAPEASGVDLGDRLLDAIVQLARGVFRSVFVEVFPHHTSLIELFADHRFRRLATTSDGEHVLARRL